MATFKGECSTAAEYELKKCVGRGHYGTVFKAVRRSEQEGAMHGTPQSVEEVAIKFIPLDARPEYLKMVKREVAIMNHLAHSHIVPVRDVFQVAQRSEPPASRLTPPTPSIALVMDLARCSLQEYLDNVRKLSEDGVRWLFQQLMLAVHHCHTKNVVQRDIKPANILVFQQRTQSNIILKLADFGWAKRFDLSDPKTRAGTLTYAAPEVLRAKNRTDPYDPGAADVWSCGVVLFRMLHPEEYRTIIRGKLDAGITAWADHIPPPPADGPSSGTPFCHSFGLLHWMLQVDPEQRATMEEVMNHPWFTKGLPPGAMELRQGSGRPKIDEAWLDQWLVDAITRHTGVQL